MSDVRNESVRTWKFVPSSSTKGLIQNSKTCIKDGKEEHISILQRGNRGQEDQALVIKVGTEVYNKGGKPTSDKVQFTGIDYLIRNSGNTCWQSKGVNKQKLDKKEAINLSETDIFLVAIHDTHSNKLFLGVDQWKNINTQYGMTIDKVNQVLKGQKQDTTIVLDNNILDYKSQLGKGSATRAGQLWSRWAGGKGGNFLQYYGCLIFVNKEEKYELGKECTNIDKGEILPEGQTLGSYPDHKSSNPNRSKVRAIIAPLGAVAYEGGNIKIGKSYKWNLQVNINGDFKLIR